MAATTHPPALGRTGLVSPAPAGPVLDNQLASSPLVTAAYYLTILFVVMLVGRTPEITVSLMGSSFYQILVLNVILLGFLLISGMLVRVGSSPGGAILIAFHLWIVFTLPFSGYRRGSIDALQMTLPYVPSFFFVGGFFTRSVETLRRGVTAMAVAGLVGLVFILKSGAQLEEDRLVSEGSFGNSNLLAIYLMVMIPLWAYHAWNKHYRWIVRLGFAAAIVLALSAVMKTGSRSGFLSVVLLSGTLFLSVSVANKAKFIVVAVIGSVLAAGAMSDTLKSRLGTIFHSERNDYASDEAQGSSDERYKVLVDSIDKTFRNPLTGVGYGVFSAVAAMDIQKTGKRANWLVTHNMYTQVSVELGFPGLFLYMAGLLWSVRVLWRARKAAKIYPEMRDLGPIANALLCAWLMFAFNGFFTSMATDFLFYVLSGFSIAMYFVSESTMRQRTFGMANGDVVPETEPSRSTRFFPAPPPASGVTSARPSSSSGGPVPPPEVKNADAPWRRNPRRHPPLPGTPSR